MKRFLLLTALLVPLVAGSALAQAPFDHQHPAWAALLKKHVVLQDGGKASQLRYPDIRSVWDFGKIFGTYPWYSVDFTSGLRGIQSREQFFSSYADLLADDPELRKIVREHKAEIRHLDYDWNLNDTKK